MNTLQSSWQIFRWPIVLAVASIIGLISALIGDGWFDVVSWICLGATVFVVLLAWHRNIPSS